MKKYIALIFVTLISIINADHCTCDEMYFKVIGGTNLNQSPHDEHFIYHNRPGVLVGGAIGWHAAPIWSSFELEGAYRSNHAKVNWIGFLPEDYGSKEELYTLMVNYLFKGYELGCFRPYIGAGIGQSYLNIHDYSLDVKRAGLATLSQDMKGTGFAAQLIGGVAVPVARKVELALEYRYLLLTQVLKQPEHGVSLALKRSF